MKLYCTKAPCGQAYVKILIQGVTAQTELLQVQKETTFRFVVGMTDALTGHSAALCHKTVTRHIAFIAIGIALIVSKKCAFVNFDAGEMEFYSKERLPICALFVNVYL